MKAPAPGDRYKPSWPDRWAPERPGVPVRDIPNTGQGHGSPARRSIDGTIRYCHTCDTVTSPRATYCPVHRSERTAWINRNPSSQSITFSPAEVESLHSLDAKINSLVFAIGTATVGYRSTDNPPAWVNDLMLATKDAVDAWQETVANRIQRHS